MKKIKITPRTILGLDYGYSSDGPRTIPTIFGTIKTLPELLTSIPDNMSIYLMIRTNGKWKPGKLYMGYIGKKPCECSLRDAADRQQWDLYGEPFFIPFEEEVEK